MSDCSNPDPVLEALPDASADRRRSWLGGSTDTLQERLLPDRIGPVRGLHILDVGCGDGMLTKEPAGQGAKVIGLDASADMISPARRRAELAAVEIDVVFEDTRNLRICGAQFDGPVSVARLCFSDEPRQPIREMVRVLRPGGRLIPGDPGRWNFCAAQRRVKGWLGSGLWRAAYFRNRRDLLARAAGAGLEDATVTGAIFCPPLGCAAQLMTPVDPWIGRRTSGGAAFLVLSATKPIEPEAETEPT